MTVYGMVVSTLAVPAGEYLLQTAAGSVLGRQIIQVGGWGHACSGPCAGGAVRAAERLAGCQDRQPRASRLPLPVSPPSATMQLCKHRGIKTINVVRRDEGLAAELTALG